MTIFLRKFFTFFICFASSASISQQPAIDSLTILLQTSKEDTNKVILLHGLSWSSRNIDPEAAEKYGKKSLDLAKKLNYGRGIIKAYTVLSSVYYNQSDYDKAIQSQTMAIVLCLKTNDKKNLAVNYVNISNIYGVKGDNAKCIEYLFKGLRIGEEINNKEITSNAYCNIGAVYMTMKKNEEALNYLNKALVDATEINDTPTIISVTDNIASIYAEKDSLDLALSYFHRSLKLNEELGNKKWMAYELDYIASVHHMKKEYDNALEYDLRALALFKELDFTDDIAFTLMNVGSHYAKQGQYAKAIEHVQEALGIALQINTKPTILEATRHLSDYFAELNNFKNAYEYHRQYSDVKDSLLNEESSKQITEMQTKYETEKKEQQITLLNKDRELRDAQLNRQIIVIWSVVCGLCVVMILSVFIFRERRKSEKLLLNILPAETARELKANGKATARHYESVTVMFTDFKGFTAIAEKLSAQELVSELDFLFKKFDEIISKYAIEKIKTIGDAYMCAAGLPIPSGNHAENIVKAAIEIQDWMTQRSSQWQLRIGIHTGPVTAGVVGDKKFAYDIWGDAVNTASRMESSGVPGKINISGTTFQFLKDLPKFKTLEGLVFTHRGKVFAKNKGEVDMYFVEKSSENEFIGG